MGVRLVLSRLRAKAFKSATQLTVPGAGEMIGRLADDAMLAGDGARRLARIGVANYSESALLLP